MSAVALLGGWTADALLGDPRRGHPVAGFGHVASRVEAAAHAPRRGRGAACVAALVGGTALLAELAARRLGRGPVLVAVTWAALGGRSLGTVAARIAAHLHRDDLAGARTALPALVGRDPAALDADGVARAVVESVAENTSDAVVGALFWGAVAGPAGVAGFRAANTLDAMWGHRSDRYADFGWAAARLDDALGAAPARLTAALTAAAAPLVGGSPARALAAARSPAALAHPSPNAGVVEAAFAGALGVRLGGRLSYGGRTEDRPVLHATGRSVAVGDVARVVRLSRAVGLGAAGVCALARHAARRTGR
ncbi:cobalamin biosynthesis protein [Conexibacter sp. W3-3-2]|uniref:CobD/CbiB family cobalamin biosynthesis protein n=1 Tax=Conexibacter sp. W3-3-2 TaxID=2675227 RepID=UPI0012BA351E|nr:CobD/CbiB family cobalamin biosynthesis protein [Conexibacter sp. W3-3-2]MTD45741.1 cobalamin biosynthesis protein [Conexibacter sp. W3-3-2]